MLSFSIKIFSVIASGFMNRIGYEILLVEVILLNEPVGCCLPAKLKLRLVIWYELEPGAVPQKVFIKLGFS